MNTKRIARALMGACTGALLLAACGGHGDGSPDTGATSPVELASDVPASARQSADGAFDFVASVAATRDDTAEPLVVGDATLASSDTDESKAVR
ncbi:MAG TPA: hypothetical protein VLK85_12055 [Ramlibacter sp.]|nr:hypothetical protein [Ramlibacter sp.]